MALVETPDLLAYLAKVGATDRAGAFADEAAVTASVSVLAYCSRLKPDQTGLDVVGGQAPPIVRRVALSMAARLAANPHGLRSLSAGEQQVDLPAVAPTYWESTLLNAYRRRTA